ncbi:MAG: DUF4105 domain-containing protein [Pseudobdellovibrionaceae bacterium]
MALNFLKILFLTLIISLHGHAQLFLVEEACACQSGQVDAFEFPKKFNFGKLKGQCIDSCRFRNLEMLEANSEEIFIASILHEGKFWKAKVTKAFSSVEMGFENFAPSVDHVFLKFQMSEGSAVTLFHLEDSFLSPKYETKEIKTLVLSIEGVPAKGSRYSLIDAFFGNYLVAYRLLSAEDAHKHMVIKQKNPVSFYPLHFKSDEILGIFEKSMSEANKFGFKQHYDLLSNNCATSAFALLPTSDKFSKVWYKKFFVEMAIPLSIHFPFSTKYALRQLGYMTIY